jgi:hypothetical protein
VNVHVEDARLLAEEMIVHGGDVEPVLHER